MAQDDVTVGVVRRWRDGVLQQVAAESYWHLSDTQAEILRRGNSPRDPNDPTKLPSQFIRLTSTQASDFISRYNIAHHHANDSSGFSATLLFDTQAQKYTLAFRSTEYKNPSEGGDFDRDGKSGAGGEIQGYGFAFGQLSAMEAYYAYLKSHVLPEGSKINVSGYSLGGHLALVFTELHATEIEQTLVFNSAGRGSLELLPGR